MKLAEAMRLEPNVPPCYRSPVTAERPVQAAIPGEGAKWLFFSDGAGHMYVWPNFKQGTTPSFYPQSVRQIISCVLHHQLNGKNPSRYLRGSRPLKGTALRAGPRWLHPS